METKFYFGIAEEKLGWYNPMKWVFGNPKIILEKKMLNRFSRDPVKARDITWTDHQFTGKRRKLGKQKIDEGASGNYKWECECINLAHHRPVFIVAQKYELWEVNTTLDAYYKYISGFDIGLPGTLAGLPVGPGATEILAPKLMQVGLMSAMDYGHYEFGSLLINASAATTGAGVIVGIGGAFYAGYYAGTAIAAKEHPPEKKISEGWEFKRIECGPDQVTPGKKFWVPCV